MIRFRALTSGRRAPRPGSRGSRGGGCSDAFRALVCLVEGCSDAPSAPVEEILGLARINRVYLHAARRLGIRDPAEEALFVERLRVLDEVSGILDGLEAAFFKLLRPVEHVPADLDVLVGSGSLARALARLLSSGFAVVARDSYALTLRRRGALVDLYLHPAVGDVVYLRGSELLRHSVERDFHGVRVRTLEEGVEALVAACHAFYKEWLYTLNDYLTVKRWARRATLRLAEEMMARDALDYAFKLNELVGRGALALPRRLSAAELVLLAGKKIARDSWSRRTLSGALLGGLTARGLMILRDRLTRATY